MTITTISSYKFVNIDPEKLTALSHQLKDRASQLSLKGSVILSPEGINLFLAGHDPSLASYQDFLKQQPNFEDLTFNAIYSQTMPFKRLVIKIKNVLIPFGDNSLSPMNHKTAYISPEKLKQWYDQGKPMTLLDARNTYEVQLGTFKNAVDLNIRSFRDFPNQAKQLSQLDKKQTLVTFCTGGIRCEKVAIYLEQQGFESVYQLKSGIINYFKSFETSETFPYYQGECFVFDPRIAIDTHRQATETLQCTHCRKAITAAEQALSFEHCPSCQHQISNKKQTNL